MRACYVIAREGASGGTGSLSYRIFSFLHSKGHACAYLYCENNSPQTVTLLESVTDELILNQDYSFQTQFETIKDKYESFVFLTYSISEFLAIDKLRRTYPSITRSILYIVHAFAFSIPPELDLSTSKKYLLRIYLKIRYRSLAKSLVKNGSILFMDVQSVQETERSLKLNINRDLIQLLPIDIRMYPSDYWESVKKHSPFTIGTMCRMDFPFKGYVLGLIDQFALLYKKYDLRLYIVGDGPNGEELRNKIHNLPCEIQDRITYQRSIPYSDLGVFYSKCDLALGMGTMLLDAANYNVLAAPVNAYTYKLEVGGLFLDNIDWLLLKDKVVDFGDLLSKILLFSQDEFANYIHRQYQELKTYYSIDKFCDLFVNTSIGKNPMKCRQRIIYDIINTLR